MSIDHISVCICTYKRPFFLAHLLHCLWRQDTAGAFEYSTVVVDNDASGSASMIANNSPAKPAYYVEPRQNISLARNMAVTMSRGNLIVFIDDDEFPQSDRWLYDLYHEYKRSGASGICAPVEPVFISPVPEWMKTNLFYYRKRCIPGEELPWFFAYTSNTMLDKGLFDRGFKFEESWGRMGGEDTAFFREAKRAGYLFTWSAAAGVREWILPAKISLRWIFRRAARTGISYSVIAMRGASVAEKVLLVVRILGALLVHALCLIMVLPLGRKRMLDVSLKLTHAFGKLLGLFGHRIIEYDGK